MVLTPEMREVVKLVAHEIADRTIADHEARGLANSALQAIQSHERLCLERAKVADSQRDRVEAKLHEIADGQRKQMLAVIGILVAALAFFLVPYFQRSIPSQIAPARVSFQH